ncbi:MAG TPA: CHAD domain-containing protein [Terriglobales bacterium]|jgi:CHAD domain-containing protein|nr:CHAD domain-containing protein [Terriglobales bacterium]
MSLDLENTCPLFRKLSRQLSKMAKRPAADNVHKFRTSSRRVEVLVADLSQKRNRNDKKLLKLLGRLRKKAGKLRDLDVQTAALRSLKIPQEPGRKSQLLRMLAEERGKREKKLAKALDNKTVAEVRKRLKRSASSLDIAKTTDPISIAIQQVSQLDTTQSPVTDEILHRFRIAGKRARYVAEMAGKSPEAARLVGQLKNMQDAIGDWHDWAQLAERAEKLFGSVQESALVAALRNLTRAKFRQAVHTLMHTRSAFSGKKPAPVTTLGRRPSKITSTPDTAVA